MGEEEAVRPVVRIGWILSGLFALLWGSPAIADDLRIAVVVGNNQGHDPEETLRYAERDARKVHGVLTELGAFSSKHSRLLLDADAGEVWKAIRGVEKQIAKQRRASGEKALLLFFYSGHAEGDELELGDTSLRFGELMAFLRKSSADVRLAFLDSCQSGKLIAAKGGRRGPGFEIRVTDQITSQGYAIITSSAHDELSQESAEIRGAFFTHYLVSALRGAGDKSGDGRVTLNEAYRYAYERTLARTSTTIGGSQHPMYEFELSGRGEIVLTQTAQARSRISVTLPEPGRVLLMDQAGVTILAEAEVLPAKTAVFAVPPGQYSAYLLSADEHIRLAHVRVAAGERATLASDDFQTAVLENAVAKGGLFSDSEREWIHRLGVGGLWRLWPLWGASDSFGATVMYRAESPSGWEPAMKLTWTSRPDVGVSSGYWDMGLLAGMGYVLPLGGVLARAQLLAGYEHLVQAEREGQSRHSSGFDYLGIAGLELPSRTLFASLDFGAGGRVFQVIDKGWVHRLDLQVLLTLGWTWGERR